MKKHESTFGGEKEILLQKNREKIKADCRKRYYDIKQVTGNKFKS